MNFPVSRVLTHLPEYDLLRSLTDFASRQNIQLYLVGGTVRDLLMDRKFDDLDFSMAGDAISFAQDFASSVGSKAIVLDEEQGTARLIFNHGAFYMDFSRIRGADIMEDLGARDITINAMAIDFNRLINDSEAAVIDPYGGIENLDNKLIRTISAKNITDDPIRLLRIYRFSATLGFTIHNDTLLAIHDNADLLSSVSVERVREELFKILSVNHSVKCLEVMDAAGLLEKIFPEIIQMKGIEQNEYHHLDVWGHSMLTMDFFERDPIPNSLRSCFPEVESYLNYELVKGRTRRSLLKLIALLHDVGKPATRTVDMKGRIKFIDHYLKGAEIAENIGTRLKLANREIMYMAKIIEYHMYPLMLVISNHQYGENDRAIRRFIQKVRFEWLPVLLIAFADMRATQGPRHKATDLNRLNHLIGKVSQVYFQETDLPQLITGDDIMSKFSLSAAPIIGKLIKQVKEAQITGMIKTRGDALEFIKRILDK